MIFLLLVPSRLLHSIDGLLDVQYNFLYSSSIVSPFARPTFVTRSIMFFPSIVARLMVPILDQSDQYMYLNIILFEIFSPNKKNYSLIKTKQTLVQDPKLNCTVPPHLSISELVETSRSFWQLLSSYYPNRSSIYCETPNPLRHSEAYPIRIL